MGTAGETPSSPKTQRAGDGRLPSVVGEGNRIVETAIDSLSRRDGGAFRDWRGGKGHGRARAHLAHRFRYSRPCHGASVVTFAPARPQQGRGRFQGVRGGSEKNQPRAGEI